MEVLDLTREEILKLSRLKYLNKKASGNNKGLNEEEYEEYKNLLEELGEIFGI